MNIIKKDIIFAQIGTPEKNTVFSIRKFLKSFLSSPRVVDLPRWKWFPILHLFILPWRPRKLMKHYQSMGENPTHLATKQMEHFFSMQKNDEINFHFCSIFDEVSIDKVSGELSATSERYIIPLYPQYSEATSELIFDHLRERFNAKCEARVLASDYFNQRSSEYIIEELAQTDASALLLSFHSYPLHRLEKGDSYGVECIDCFESIKSLINSSNRIQIELCYQSKFGKGAWLSPLIDEKILEVKELGHRSIAVYCPSFLIDSLETTWEIGIDLKKRLKTQGIDLHFIPCIGTDASWLFALHQAVMKKY